RSGQKTVAYGKTAPDDLSGRQFLIMDRLWRLPARRCGRLRLARPLAYRSEASLLLQAAVPGQPVGRDRNRRIFHELARNAGPALASIHDSGIGLGSEQRLESVLRRLRNS